MTFNFCTYFDWNYRLKGLALYESLERHCSDFHLWVLALDKSTEILLTKMRLENLSPIAMGSFEYERLLAARDGRSTREYYWTCTPGWILYVLASVGTINYVDADIMFFADPTPVFQEIGDRDIAITPHDFPHRLRHMVSNGVFNVGLVHVKGGGLGCIQEWEAQCLNWCYLRHDPRHLDWFCDQKYLDKWPERWGAYAIQHKGANRAPWNMEKYRYRCKGDKVYVDEQELIWWHYHGYEGEHQMYPETYIANSLQLTHVYKPYVAALRRADERIRQVL